MVLTEKQIHELDSIHLTKLIVEEIFLFTEVTIHNDLNIKVVKGKPQDGVQNTTLVVPNYAEDMGVIGALISVLCQDNRLDLDISRANKVTTVILYDKHDRTEYVSTSYNHSDLPRLICEAALKWSYDIQYKVPMVPVEVETSAPFITGDESVLAIYGLGND